MKQYILYMNLTDSFHQFFLPNEDDRSLALDVSEIAGTPDCVLKLECFGGVWSVAADEEVVLYENDRPASSVRLGEEGLVYGLLRRSGRKFSLLLDALSGEHVRFRKFSIAGRQTVSLGKENADLCLRSEYISRDHALLVRERDGWFVQDRGRNGVYLNSRRIPQGKNVPLRLFDELYTGGFRIVFLGGALAVNHASRVLTALPAYAAPPARDASAVPEHTAFLRSPRRYEEPARERIEIEGPPQPQQQRKQPLLFILGPALTTPLPILLTMLLRMNLSADGSMGSYWIMGVSVVLSALIGLGWTMARRRYDARESTQTEQRRTEEYRKYLAKNEALLREKGDDCRALLLRQNLSADELCRMLEQNRLNEFLWNRSTRYGDFSSVRIGIGQMPFPGEIVVPKERFSVSGDPLAEEPARLREKYRVLYGTPSLVSLRRCRLLGVLGGQERVMGAVRNMVVQLAAQHSYTDLRLAFFYDRTESAALDWVRWLPHVFSPDRQRRYLGCDADSCASSLAALMEILRERAEARGERREGETPMPLYVVFCTRPALFYNSALYSYITGAEDFGFVFVLAYGRMDLLPNECRYLLSTEDEPGFSALDRTLPDSGAVSLETVGTAEAAYVARALSRFWVNENAAGEMPLRVEFLDMYGIADLRRWELIKHWRENRAYESIRARIGSTYGGQPVWLDIHEKQHGPHGLVAGTTGSGKSEMLQTFILSLMLNYAPDEVAFILIDYKGGGMANLFDGAPHLAGTITNLGASGGDSSDCRQTRRALVSLRSEIQRRQRLLAQYGVNHIDPYNRLYRAGKVREPMPHLVIISDEFAELKREQPDFIKELVSTARVGRSLGVHLILATQKPAGVVDDEIWSNARFKICLRVQDRSDSMGMLHRPEAAGLQRTGQGYLQIGNNESFLLFQSGYSGAPYRPDADPEERRSNAVEFLRLDGERIRAADTGVGGACSQLDAGVRYIREVSAENHVARARQLWLSALPGVLPFEPLLAELPENDRYCAVLGRMDCPERQRQPLLTVSFPSCGHILTGGVGGSGKSGLLRVLTASLCCTLRPEEFVWYALDYSSHAFEPFARDAHCGGIVYAEDAERTERLFRLLYDRLRARKKELASAGAASAADYRAQNPGRMPVILLLIDNYAGFAEQSEPYMERLQKLLRDGAACGIHVAASAVSLSDIPGRLRQFFTTLLPLVLSERGEYYEFLECAPQELPSGCPGSGVTVYGGEVVQFQTAQIADPARLCASFRASECGCRAQKIPYIDHGQSYDAFFREQDVPGRAVVPLGWYEREIKPYCLSLWDTHCYAVSDVSGEGAHSMTENLLYALREKGAELRLIGAPEHFEEARDVRAYQTQEEIVALMRELLAEFQRRVAARNAYKEQHGTQGLRTYLEQEFRPYVVLIESYSAFCGVAYAAPAEGQTGFREIFETYLRDAGGLGVTFIAVLDEACYGQWYTKNAVQLLLAGKTGVHLGGRLDRQKLVRTELPLREQMKAAAPETGLAVEAGRVSAVYIPAHDAGGREED